MIGIPQRTQLAFQQDGLAFLQGLMQEAGGVDHHGPNLLRLLLQVSDQGLQIDLGLVIQVAQGGVLLLHRAGKPGAQHVLVIQLADLHADFQILIAVKRSNAALGGAEARLAQPFFLILVKGHMIGQQYLCPVADVQLGHGHAAADQTVQFLHEPLHVQRHAGADHIDDVAVEHARGQQVQRKFTVIVDNGMAGVGAALKTNHDVAVLRHHVRDLSLAFVSPVGAYDASNHN